MSFPLKEQRWAEPWVSDKGSSEIPGAEGLKRMLGRLHSRATAPQRCVHLHLWKRQLCYLTLEKGRCRCDQRFGGGEIVLGDPRGPTGPQGSLEEGGRRIRVREMWKNALLLALSMEEGATD